MSRLSNAALRLTSGALILNSGISKFSLDTEAYAHLQQMAKAGVPQVEALPADQFGKILASAETALGAALLCPIISPKLAGLGLTAFSASMLTIYFGNEAMTLEDGVRPSQEGTTLAKDFVLLGAGLALLFSRKGK